MTAISPQTTRRRIQRPRPPERAVWRRLRPAPAERARPPLLPPPLPPDELAVPLEGALALRRARPGALTAGRPWARSSPRCGESFPDITTIFRRFYPFRP